MIRRTSIVSAALAAVMLWAGGAQAGLAGRINAALAGKYSKQAGRVGVCVTLMPSGKVLYARRADELFIPASNEKIVTTASALFHLGPDYEFETLFWADGPVEGGVLKGNLVVQGSGDPNISGRFQKGDVSFLPRAWARILLKRGIRIITGDLVLDDTLFDRQFTHPSWPADQLGRWYAAPVASLAFNDSCLNVTISATAPGQPVRVTPAPDTSFVTIVNRAVTTASRQTASRQPIVITRAPGSSEVSIRGTWYKGRGDETFFVSIENPSMFFGTVLADEMKRAGLTLNGAVRLAKSRPPQVTARDRRVQIIHASRLVDAVDVCNKNSQNFYAEMLFKRAGAKCFGTGTFENGAKAADVFLAQAGIAPGACTVSDGSGLSRDNRFTPRQLASVLGWAYNSKFAEDYVDSFGLSGIDRTMRKRLTDPAYRGKIAAKTGTLDGVAALSGYAFNRGGQVLVFSILANDTRGNWNARAIMDDVCKALVDEPIE